MFRSQSVSTIKNPHLMGTFAAVVVNRIVCFNVFFILLVNPIRSMTKKGKQKLKTVSIKRKDTYCRRKNI